MNKGTVKINSIYGQKRSHYAPIHLDHAIPDSFFKTPILMFLPEKMATFPSRFLNLVATNQKGIN